jgi:hypothetical protein
MGNMKLIKTYSQIINEETKYVNFHLLTEDQVRWIERHVDVFQKHKLIVNDNREVCVHHIYDGTTPVPTYIKIINNPDSIPVQFGDIDDRFELSDCKNLTSLKGSPRSVGNLILRDCPELTSLEGGPDLVKDKIVIELCDKLESLNGSFKLTNNISRIILYNNYSLKSLEGMPTKIRAIISINGCTSLTDLRGISSTPRRLGIHNCTSLTSLYGLDKDYSGEIVMSGCGLPNDKIVYNWKNDISGEEAKTFNDEWEI